MEPVLCEIGSDFAAVKGSLLDALDKANKLVEELPPSSTKDSISRSMLHMWAGHDLLRGASVATGTATSTPAVNAIPVPIPGLAGPISMKWRATCTNPWHSESKKKKTSEETGENAVEEDEKDSDEEKLYTGRPKCTCACGATFPDAEQVDAHGKGVHLASKTWNCTGVIIEKGSKVPCKESFDNGEGMWKHYHHTHLNLYWYMCTLKIDGKKCNTKTDERATWFYHKEVVHQIGRTQYRCKFCDKPMVQICKIAPHQKVCSMGETGKKEKLIECKYCQKGFRGRQYYLHHLGVTHSKESGVKHHQHHCNICGHDYSNASALKNHVCCPIRTKRCRKPKSSTVSSTTD